MKMNDTVARIVEIMFQDVEMDEEVSAIRDEVMDNCQERYNDLIASGIAEDDAIAAVIESLRGMDDVLAPYKRVARRHAKMEDLEDIEDMEGELEDEEDSETNAAFAAHLVQKIDLSLVNEDVYMEASDDGNYHVIWNTEESPLVHTALVDGVLRIDRCMGEEKILRSDGSVETHGKTQTADFVRTEKGKIEINMDSIGNMLTSVADSLKKAFSQNHIHISVGFSDSGVTIQVPANAMPHVTLLTTSGDIKVEEVALADLNITSTSGDVNVDLNEAQQLSQINLRTTSGDIGIRSFAERMSISSTSGDVEVEGRIGHLSVNTISGDINVRADVVGVTFKAVSGDVDLQFDSDEIRDVRGSTISGDIDIELPEGIGSMGIYTQTRTGDVTNRFHTNGMGPTVSGGVSSLSGDITIR